MKEDPQVLRERFRTARENLWALMLIVLGVGLCLNLATNILASYILESKSRGVWLAIAMALILILTLWFIMRINSKGYDFITTIEVMLPFCVSVNTVEILAATPYPLTRRASELFGRLMQDGESQARFLRDWHGAQREKQRPFQGFVRKCVTDMQCYLILDILREYCEQTLTQKGIFNRYGWKPMKMPARKWSSDEWPAQLKDNVYLKNSKAFAFQYIHLPEFIGLSMSETKADSEEWHDSLKGAEGMQRKPGDETFDLSEPMQPLDPTVIELRQRSIERGVSEEKQAISLKSPFGEVSLIYSPFQRKISARSREGIVMHKYCGMVGHQEVWLAKFTINVVAYFGGWRIFGNYFKQDFFPWVSGFIDSLKNRLDWDLCLEHDLERMMVDLCERIEALQDSQSELREQVKSLVEVRPANMFNKES